jgi:hypothetical protein
MMMRNLRRHANCCIVHQVLGGSTPFRPSFLRLSTDHDGRQSSWCSRHYQTLTAATRCCGVGSFNTFIAFLSIIPQNSTIAIHGNFIGQSIGYGIPIDDHFQEMLLSGCQVSRRTGTMMLHTLGLREWEDPVARRIRCFLLLQRRKPKT